MFRDMRRKNQLLSEEETIEILKRCTAGVLGVNGDDGYPYTVPMSYAYKDNKIFMHCAKEGHKLDSIMKDDKVTFTVIDRDEIIPEKFDTHYKSVIAFGRARIVTDIEEKRIGLQAIIAKYSPGFIKEGFDYIESDGHLIHTIAIDIEHITGKASKQLINSK